MIPKFRAWDTRAKEMFKDTFAITEIGGMPAVYLKGLLEGYAWTGSEEILGNIYENQELLEVE